MTYNFLSPPNQFNPIQAGGGGAHCAPYRFFPCCAKTVSSRPMKLSDL